MADVKVLSGTIVVVEDVRAIEEGRRGREMSA